MTTIVLLGGNRLNAGLAEIARVRGARVVVVDWNEHPDYAGEEHVRLDIKDVERVVEALRPRLNDVAYAYTSADVATPTVAAIHSALGYPTPPPEALRRASDKIAMSEAWERAGLLGKRFRACTSQEDVATFAAEVGVPVIVKPAESSSSRGVTFVPRSDAAACAEAYARAAAKDPRGRVLVETYVTGTEFTVEMVGDAEARVRVFGISKKYHTKNAGQNRIAVKLHYNAPDVSRERKERIAEFARRCYRALGLRASLGHFEVMERPDGSLVPVEMAARSSGFIVSHLVDAALGRPGAMLSEYERVLRGGTVAEGLEEALRSSMYFFYDMPPSRIAVEGRSLADHLPAGVTSLAFDREKLRKGHVFGPIDSDNERAGHEILVGDTEVLTIQAVESAERAYHAEVLTPPDASGVTP